MSARRGELSKGVLSGDARALNAYLGFLKAGSSEYPIEILKKAGVDMSTPRPIQDTMDLFSQLLDELEKLLKINGLQVTPMGRSPGFTCVVRNRGLKARSLRCSRRQRPPLFTETAAIIVRLRSGFVRRCGQEEGTRCSHKCPAISMNHGMRRPGPGTLLTE